MNSHIRPSRNVLGRLLWIALAAPGLVLAQELPRFTAVQRITNGEIALAFTAPRTLPYRLEVSTNILQWDPLVTLVSTGQNQYLDSAAPYLASRFYRALELSGTNNLTGDHFQTDDGEIVVHPINHASVVIGWSGGTIYSDPVGGAAPFQGLPRANLILVTHSHTDHFSAATLDAVKRTNAVIIAPPAVYSSLPAALKSLTIVLANGGRTNVLGLGVEAVPAYTITTSNHPKGLGNGYVLTIGGKRVYVSGDSEDIPEMRALQNVDVAFVCMNVPFTMSVAKAASAVRAFHPRIVFPYHYRNQDGSLGDLNSFKRQVGADLGIEVRLRKWY